MKTNIIFKESNYKRLEEVLDKVQARASVRCLNITAIKLTLANIEKYMDAPKKSMKGLRIRYSPNKIMNGYKWTPEGTCFIAENNGNGWKIINIEREYVSATNDKTVDVLHMPEELGKLIMQKHMCFWA